MLPGSLEGCRQACPRPQTGCSMFRVPGHFLQEMTQIGQDGFVDWSCHFLETFNYNQSYQTRKHNVLAAITDVTSQFVLFLRRKFQVPVFQAPAVDLPIPPVHGFGSRRSSVWTPTSSSTECSREAATEVEEEHRRSLGRKKRCRARYCRKWWRVCCDIIPTMIPEESAATFALLLTLCLVYICLLYTVISYLKSVLFYSANIVEPRTE